MLGDASPGDAPVSLLSGPGKEEEPELRRKRSRPQGSVVAVVRAPTRLRNGFGRRASMRPRGVTRRSACREGIARRRFAHTGGRLEKHLQNSQYLRVTPVVSSRRQCSRGGDAYV